MRRKFGIAVAGIILVGCSSHDIGPYALTDEDKAQQRLAASRAMCRIENQKRCDHLIENRTLFGRFFAPQTVGGLDEDEKIRGRRITTKFVVEALSTVQQCNRVEGQSVKIISGMEIDKRKFDVMGSSPLIENQSACFIQPSTENS